MNDWILNESFVGNDIINYYVFYKYKFRQFSTRVAALLRAHYSKINCAPYF